MSNEPLKCLVVDDEPLAAALIAGYVERTPGLALAATALSAAEALGVLASGEVDAIFTDIHMPGLSGIDLAAAAAKHIRIVFTTAYPDHALDGFDLGAVHYLLKPVSYAKFLEAADRLTAAATAPAPPAAEFITVKSEYRLIRIPVEEILYVESLKDYLQIYLTSARPVLSQMSMKAIEEVLAGTQIMRVHRSFMVNLSHVRVIERNTIVLAGRAIPVSEAFRQAFARAMGLKC